MPPGRSDAPLDVPVLLLAFRRPDTTAQVVAALRAQRPARLFVACDGPRPGRTAEAQECRATRELIDRSIDWPCEVTRLFRDQNLGCRRGVSEGIGWFFEHVSEGIILEDDVVPEPSFFGYCRELLARYRDDERIGMISGNTFRRTPTLDGASYYFSMYPHIWGWATWRRAWASYDADMQGWPAFREQGRLLDVGSREFARDWTKVLDAVWRRRIDTWDYVWNYSFWRQGYLACLPAVNLVRNVGFEPTATHTKTGECPLREVGAIALPLRHPEVLVRDRRTDDLEVSLFAKPLWRRAARAVLDVGRRAEELVARRWAAGRPGKE